jgi:hypothetical protein
MRNLAWLMLAIAMTFLVGCQNTRQVCPDETGTPHYLTASPDELPTPIALPGPISVEIGQREMQVDRIVEGPLCNDTWSGTVYVTCDIQVYAWEETPTFLKDCDLKIESGTIVYVADHNDTAYYNGCSCHTGEIPEP